MVLVWTLDSLVRDAHPCTQNSKVLRAEPQLLCAKLRRARGVIVESRRFLQRGINVSGAVLDELK
jgi:hypothetical protein